MSAAEDAERIEREEAFAAWKDHPVTKLVMGAFSDLGEQCKQRWVSVSWDKGNADPFMLADLRARAEVVEDMVDLTFEELEIALGQHERD